jgi:hypothetical protein
MDRARKEKINRLFDAIGELDDYTIQQAMDYRPAKRNSRQDLFLRLGAIAACILLIVGIASWMERLLKAPSFSPEENYPTADEVPQSLDALFQSKIDSGSCIPLSATQARERMGNGFYYLMWEDAQTGQLYTSEPLTKNQMRRLQEHMGKGTAVGPDEPSPFYRVWLVCGDGSVLTPYLKSSNGNVGYMTLFDYDAELYPSKEFISCVSQILG